MITSDDGKYQFSTSEKEIDRAKIRARLHRLRDMRRKGKIASYFGRRADEIVIVQRGILLDDNLRVNKNRRGL